MTPLPYLPHGIVELLSPSSLALVLFVYLFGRWIASLVHHFLFDPLRHVPTYNVSLAFPLWTVMVLLRGNGFALKESVHRAKETGINEVDLSDPDAIHRVLRILDEPKHKETYEMGKFFKDDPDDIVLVSDISKHKELRRMFAPGFSIKYLGNLEPLMSKVVHNFETVLQGHGESGTTVDIADCFHNIATDIIGETAFGQSFDMVHNPNHSYQAAIKALIPFFVLRLALPFVPESMLGMHKLRDAQASHVRMCIQNRREKMQAGHVRDDILQIILDHRDSYTGAPIIEEEIAVHARIFLLAGSETTANTMAWTLLFLLKNPAAFDRLKKELDAAFPDGMKAPLSLAKLKTLPWFDACVKEALRLKPILPAMIRTARSDLELSVKGYDGKARTYCLPKGTVIRTNAYAAQRNPSVWLRPDEYLPERWLTHLSTKEEEAFTYSSSGTARKDEHVEAVTEKYDGPQMLHQRAFMPFSMGSRDCLGRNFAWNEMRLVLGHLIRRYDVVPEFDVNEILEGKEMATLSVGRKGGMPVKLIRRI